jgi:hypothetical protein
MVRRWSYLNLFNKAQSYSLVRDFEHLLPAHYVSLFQLTTYYHQPLFVEHLSKLVRRSFFRIRHRHNLVIYQNLLINWAREYLFMRKIARVVFSVRVNKYSYILQLSNLYPSKLTRMWAAHTPFKFAPLSRWFLDFMAGFRSAWPTFFRAIPNTIFVSGSTHRQLPPARRRGHTNSDLAYSSVGKHFLPTPLSAEKNLLSLIWTMCFQSVIHSLVGLYQVFILYSLNFHF